MFLAPKLEGPGVYLSVSQDPWLCPFLKIPTCGTSGELRVASRKQMVLFYGHETGTRQGKNMEKHMC